ERRAPQILKVQDARGESGDFNDYNNEFFKTQYEILKSPALAERVVREEVLQNLPLFGGKAGATAGSKPEGVVDGVKNTVKGWVKDFSPATPKADVPPPDAVSASMRLAGAYLSRLEIRP